MGIEGYLIVSALLFAIGAFGFMARRNAILMLISIELMFNAVNLSLVAFNAFLPPASNAGAVFALMIMAVARLGEHDREEDEHADRPEVDQHLGGGHDRRTEQGVHAGERSEADHHRHGGVNDVAQRDDGGSGPHHADGEHEEEDAGDVQGLGLP